MSCEVASSHHAVCVRTLLSTPHFHVHYAQEQTHPTVCFLPCFLSEGAIVLCGKDAAVRESKTGVAACVHAEGTHQTKATHHSLCCYAHPTGQRRGETGLDERREREGAVGEGGRLTRRDVAWFDVRRRRGLTCDGGTWRWTCR